MILGISANSRIVGMAILDGQVLLDYKIRLFKERWSTGKVQKIINSINAYCIDYPVKTIAHIIPHRYHRTPEIKELIEAIKAYCRANNLTLKTYSADKLFSFVGQQKAKKRALMQELSYQYPELSFVRQKELKNRKRYYNKLFEAVGAAMLSINHIH